jgi:NAD(P)-dependent dehydrogenase (short-subunit alcohol dehydrogenase family)
MTKVVIVTGASSGIGAAMTRTLIQRGDVVIGVARSAEGLTRLANRWPLVRSFPADVLDCDAFEQVVRTVVDEYGRIDAVIHAAQVMAYGRIEDVPARTFERVVDTAIHGTANVARAVLPQFRRQSHGTLVIVNSLLGQIATPRMGAYDVGKWGQLGLARVLALEVRDAPGIHVCTVLPGAINTPIYDQAANYAGKGGYPPPPVVGPERVAARIVRLLEHPRRSASVGPLNTITTLGFQFAPWLYDLLVGGLVERFVFAGDVSAPNDGNVFSPIPQAEQERGRWSRLGRKRGPGLR